MYRKIQDLGQRQMRLLPFVKNIGALRASMAKVLVLNASYEPLNITSWRRAIVLLIKGSKAGRTQR